MKTEIARNFNWGFFLSEQELRGVSDTLLEQTAKLGPSRTQLDYFARLTDATVIETHDIGALLSLENGGSKAVEKLTITAAAETYSMELTIQDGYRNPKTWTSINFTVTGPNREWVFLTSSELEERLKRCRVRSWPYLLSRPWPYVLAVVLAIVAVNWIDDLIFPRATNAEQLRALYASGKVTNPIEALIALEELRSQPTRMAVTIFRLFFGIGLPFAFLWFGSTIVPRVFPAYNFYWGEYAKVYDRHQARARILFSALVLGIIASVIAGFILRALLPAAN